MLLWTMTSFLSGISAFPFQHLFKHHTDIRNKTIIFIVAVLEMHWKHQHESAKERLVPDLVLVSRVCLVSKYHIMNSRKNGKINFSNTLLCTCVALSLYCTCERPQKPFRRKKEFRTMETSWSVRQTWEERKWKIHSLICRIQLSPLAHAQ